MCSWVDWPERSKQRSQTPEWVRRTSLGGAVDGIGTAGVLEAPKRANGSALFRPCIPMMIGHQRSRIARGRRCQSRTWALQTHRKHDRTAEKNTPSIHRRLGVFLWTSARVAGPYQRITSMT